MASTVERSIVVDVPVRVAYDQWTQFETFPEFMDSVVQVRQQDDRHVRWRSEIGGQFQEWDAEIFEQIPDQLVAWRSTSGVPNEGRVGFRPLSNRQTQVVVHIEYEPEGIGQVVGDWMGFMESRIERDLANFKRYIESKGEPDGAWRGQIEAGRVRPSDV